MFDYKKHFDAYCQENKLDLHLSFDMPDGYETANGTFDAASKTVYINAKGLANAADYEKAYYLFHELRHASQYLSPDQFSEMIRRSVQYIIMYDGTCYKFENGNYLKCKLDGSAEYLSDLYLGQPHEVDANTFAYGQVKNLYGDLDELRALHRFWMPRSPMPAETYDAVFALIDKKTKR